MFPFSLNRLIGTFIQQDIGHGINQITKGREHVFNFSSILRFVLVRNADLLHHLLHYLGFGKSGSPFRRDQLLPESQPIDHPTRSSIPIGRGVLRDLIFPQVHSPKVVNVVI